MENGALTKQHRTSHGHAFSEGDWLDVHFEACRPEYEAAIRSAGLQPGWHVLDAGCGSGSFIPVIANEVGDSGRIIALDLADENVAMVQRRAAEEWSFKTPVTAVEGSVLDVPFEDNTFDAVWCANVQEYLPDNDLLTMLSEFRRVTRPGGLIIIKDFDSLHLQLHPAPLGFFWHHIEAACRSDNEQASQHTLQTIRIWNMRRFFEQADLEFCWQQASLIERRAPLRPVERAYLGDFLSTHAGFAENVTRDDLPEEDVALWQALQEPPGENHPLDHPDLYWCEGQVVAVARVPKA